MKLLSYIGVFALGVVIGGGAVFLTHVSDAPKDTSVAPLRTGSSASVDAATKRYTNTSFGFSINYPTALTLREIPAEGGAETIVFQNPDEKQGFQIFILPYTGTQITKERIQADLKGATMKNVTDIVLPGNVAAVHFNSQAPGIGDTTEVWFIHGGYLFEVTSYAAEDAWLAAIVNTLQFTN